MKKRILPALSIIFLAASVPFLLWGFWPPRREVRALPIQFLAGELSLPEARSLQLEYDAFVRAGDSGTAKLILPVTRPAGETSIYDQYTVIAEARLELPFAVVNPADTISNTLSPTGAATFNWKIHPLEPGTLRGEIWIYLRFIPRDGGPETRQPVSVQQVQIRSGSLWNRSGAQARTIGIAALLAGLMAGAAAIFSFIPRRRKPAASTSS